ncbi:fibropellin-1-like [Littorina saxatilis]|uniref:fibropellin-1-like n=1 Tax=Littorina saxatilis TaxID=31220 RepID=UPI0038B60D5F
MTVTGDYMCDGRLHLPVSADNAEGHNCVLHVNTGGEEELLEGWREEMASGTGLHSGHGCLRRPCSNTEMCIPVHGHENSICVHSPNLRVFDCSSAPCQNGAKCEDGNNTYTCTCLPGYSGMHCETDIDECASSPCQNGGNCVDQVNAYTCNCSAGYTGDHCQTDIDECASSPCQNGGNCVDQVNAYTCNCPAGYTGDHCETNIDECASSPCQNGGNCVDQVNAITCNCSAGYSGDHCQTDIDECDSSPCQNGGNCVDQVNAYTCNCPAGYTGDHCETGAWLEMACTNSCTPAMVDCFSGRCLCQAGYYFSISQYACVQTCTNLHNSYLFYEGINYFYHDEYDEEVQDVNDITSCETRCNADPQCRTIVLYKPNMKCYFKYSTAVDFPADWRVSADSNTYQKKCV